MKRSRGIAALLVFGVVFGEQKLAAGTPREEIKQLVAQISADRIAETQRKLESFGTRNIYSTTTDPAHGIGAARQWIADQLRSYSPRLQVSFDKHLLKGDPSKRPV